jgi:hypothetical protein
MDSPYCLAGMPREILLHEILQYRPGSANAYEENAAPILMMATLFYVSRELRAAVRDALKGDPFAPDYFREYEIAIVHGNDSVAFFDWYRRVLKWGPLMTSYESGGKSRLCDYFFAEQGEESEWDMIAELACALEKWNVFDRLMYNIVAVGRDESEATLTGLFRKRGKDHGTARAWSMATRFMAASIYRGQLFGRWTEPGKPARFFRALPKESFDAEILVVLAVAVASSKRPYDALFELGERNDQMSRFLFDHLCRDRQALTMFHRRALFCGNADALEALLTGINKPGSARTLEEFYRPAFSPNFGLPLSHSDPYYRTLEAYVEGFAPSPSHAEAVMSRGDLNELVYRVTSLDTWAAANPDDEVSVYWTHEMPWEMFVSYLSADEGCEKNVLQWLFARAQQLQGGRRHAEQRLTKKLKEGLELDEETRRWLIEECKLAREIFGLTYLK